MPKWKLISKKPPKLLTIDGSGKLQNTTYAGKQWLCVTDFTEFAGYTRDQLMPLLVDGKFYIGADLNLKHPMEEYILIRDNITLDDFEWEQG